MRLRIFTHVIREQPSILDCDFHAIEREDLTLDDVLNYYGKVREYVAHEDELINSRLTWSLTINAFLFAVEGVLAGKAIDVAIELHRSSAPTGLEYAIPLLLFAQLPIAVVGMLVSIFARNSISAAHNAIQYLNTIVHVGSLPIERADNPAPVRRYNVTEIGGQRRRRTLTYIPSNALLLPRIISGGDRGRHTYGGHAYYLRLPLVILAVWGLIGAMCLGLGTWLWVYSP